MDLVVLAADKTMRLTLRALLGRPQSLGIRSIEADLEFHPGHDSGVFRQGHEFLRFWQTRASRALVVFDRDGCGGPQSREALEAEAEARLERSGWKDRSAAIVIDPELEAWFWSDSPHVGEVLGWRKSRSQLEEWLVAKGHLRQGQRKPAKPKKAVEEALRYCKTPYSPSIYYDLAAQVSFQRCVDPAFLKLTSVLQQWFPPEGLRGENFGL